MVRRVRGFRKREFGKVVKSKKSDFEKYIEEIERPDYKWVAKDLPEKVKINL